MESVKKVVEVVKAFGSDGATVKEISELADLSIQTVYNVQPIIGDYDIICVNDKKGRRYVYKENKKDAYKNSEGYMDKTAGDAIIGKKEMTEFKVGRIYENRYLVLKAFSDTIVYLEVIDMAEHPEFLNDICVRFDFGGKECFVNPHRVWSIGTYKVDVTCGKTFDMGLFRQIAGLCGMNVTEVEKEVEKVVIEEKIVEKPVESTEVQLLRQRAEIWEKAFYAVTGKVGMA